MDYLLRWVVQHHFRSAYHLVNKNIFRLNQGYLIAKILLCIFLVFLGIISWYTMSSQERRDSIVVCSRLVHASALTHGPQD